MASRRYAAAADTFDYAAAVLKNNGGVQVCSIYAYSYRRFKVKALDCT